MSDENSVPVIHYSDRLKQNFTYPLTQMLPNWTRVETRIDGKLTTVTYGEWLAKFAEQWMERRHNKLHRCAIVWNKRKGYTWVALYTNYTP